MTRRICPICDHVMKSNHYCRFCKAFVAHPNTVNATYYLNERRSGEQSSMLQISEPPASVTKRPGQQPSRSIQDKAMMADRMPAGAGKTPARTYGTAAKPQKKTYPAAGKQKNSGNAAQGVVVIVIAVIFLCMLLTGFLPFIMFLF